MPKSIAETGMIKDTLRVKAEVFLRHGLYAKAMKIRHEKGRSLKDYIIIEVPEKLDIMAMNTILEWA